ncbi:hypothetical protein RB195_010543 [Necator americanus]|uniref:Uncharacterized protein n=2 Tax=Necator americanus TaxID=51031 RepID=W2TIJ1_NECAM|nr:hypothetical protein NECAME_08909 [Necator americanus]ETN80832.1 hypothetical protein NECAME_08909 [Necator americanus]
MLRIAKEISESETASFCIYEDRSCKYDHQPSHRTVCVQTEISCDDVLLSTELAILCDDSQKCGGSNEVLFWRAVATQRANELDVLRENVEKIRTMTQQNLMEKKALDEKHDTLYSQLEEVLQIPDVQTTQETCERDPT